MTTDNNFLYFFLIGACGAIAVELLKLYELRAKLETARYRRMVRSPLFWLVAIGMAAASGYIGWGVNASNSDATPWQIILSAIGAKALIRGTAEASNANQQITLGTEDKRPRSLIRDIFS